MNADTLNKIVLNLLEATVTLYPADTTGAPVLSLPIWTGAPTEKLTVRERWRIKETTPTAAKYPRRHPLIPEYDLNLGRVWLLKTADLSGWTAGHQNYVLDVVWTEEESGQWHRRTFYGVTIAEHGLDTRDIDNGFTDDQVFAAQYYVSASGEGYPPAISNALPYTVVFTGADGVPVLLYTYDPALHQFTAQAELAARATIAYVGNCLTVTFDPDTAPTLRCVKSDPKNYRNSGAYRQSSFYRAGVKGLLVPALRSTVPVPGELPRLDFFYGALRTATLTRNGLYDVAFTQTTPSPAAGRFALYANSELIATLAAGMVSAEEFIIQ